MRFKKGKSEDEIVSHLGEGAELSGEISFTNGLRVEGIIKGKVRSEAILEIGPAGIVEAEINVRKFLIKGNSEAPFMPQIVSKFIKTARSLEISLPHVSSLKREQYSKGAAIWSTRAK